MRVAMDKPHSILLTAVLALVAVAGISSHASGKAVERALVSSASELLESRFTEYGWDFLRDGMVLGRIVSETEVVYVLTVRLYGGDHRFAIKLRDDGLPETVLELGAGPVSPYSARISDIMKSHTGDPVEGGTAIDSHIASRITASLRTVSALESSRKEADNDT